METGAVMDIVATSGRYLLEFCRFLTLNPQIDDFFAADSNKRKRKNLLLRRIRQRIGLLTRPQSAIRKKKRRPRRRNGNVGNLIDVDFGDAEMVNGEPIQWDYIAPESALINFGVNTGEGETERGADGNSFLIGGFDLDDDPFGLSGMKTNNNQASVDLLTGSSLSDKLDGQGSSTSVLPSSSSSSSSAAETAKLQQLEEELKVLKEALQRINSSSVSLPSSSSSSLSMSKEEEEVGSSTAPMAPPPPPPPPPPPAAPTRRVTRSMSNKRSPTEDQEGESSSSLRRGGSLCDVMAEMASGRTRLRKIQVSRSPGGTPARAKGVVSSSGPASHVDLIAQALKRKFSKAHGQSPEPSEKENSPNGHKSQKTASPRRPTTPLSTRC